MTPEEILYKKAQARANRDILDERIHKIDMVMREYGEENFCISFSGGRDSTVLHHLIDLALPGNTIPRVYVNTGIEYNQIVKFVKSLAEKDERFQIIEPSVKIKQMLEKEGYPFKSKHHSEMLKIYQRNPYAQSAIKYKNREYNFNSDKYPKCLQYQFEPTFNLKISDECCDKLKKEPLIKWQKENNKPFSIIGIMAVEEGQRSSAKCTVFINNKLKAFQPLAPLTKEWEDWFIEEYNIQLAPLYYSPYNFYRTGCKGCPFNITLQRDLDTLDKYFPKERAQCERIWGPVYEEYRRIGYRNMRPLDDGRQMSLDEFITEET